VQDPRLAVLALAASLALFAPACLAAPCTGQTPQHHPTDPFAFDTNSHVENAPRLHFDVCIFNPDPKFYLRFAWFVPDWAGFAPPADGIEGKHYPDPKAVPMVLKSCIEYGNAGALTTAQFFGDADEKQAADREDQSSCKPAAPVRSASLSGSDLEPFDYEFRLNFPSENANAEATMLALSAHYTLKPEGSSGYSSAIAYKLTRAPGRPEGDPQAIVMKPILSGAAERLTGFLYDQNPSGGIRLGEGGDRLLFRVKEGKSWHLAHASLQFLDRSGVQVARTQIPVFVPAQ
jgi:hypothetical protein